MNHPHIASRVRSHRKKAGLSQKDIARIVGIDEARVSRHERFGIVPPLSVALGYEAVFGLPVKDLYPRFYETIRQGIEERLAAMETELQQMNVKGRQATIIARKLEWCCERRNSTLGDLTR
jgi:transcriptional regulator with XRE-family HTH domain